MSSNSLLLKTKYEPTKKLHSFFTQKQIQITEDGQYVLTQCSEYVNIIEISSGNKVNAIETEEDEITCFSLAPNSTSVAVGFKSSSIKHYNIKDIVSGEPQLLMSFKSYHRGPVLTLCWDASSLLLATGSSDGTTRIWDLKQKFCTHSLKGACGVIRYLMFDDDLHKRPWMYGAAEEDILIWLLQAGSSKMVAKLEGHDSAVMGFTLSNSREELISCGLDKVIILWDLNTFQSKKIIPVFESLSGMVLKPADVEFFQVPDGSPDNIIFTVGNKGFPRIWNVDHGKEIWRSSDALIPALDKEVLLINEIHLVKSLNSFVLATYDNVIIFIHCDTMQVWKQLIGHNEEILDIIYVGENLSHIAVATNSPQICLYENANCNCSLVRGHTAIVMALANHPTDKCIFGSSSHDNTARIWRLNDNNQVDCLAVASGHTHSIGSLTFGIDFLITGSKDTCIKKWSFNLKQLSKDKKEASLLSVRTERAHEKDINSVALSKNFSLVVTASVDKTGKIWNGDSLECVGTLKGHRKGVWNAQFSPTDCVVATASADGTIKLWALPACTNVTTLEGHEVGVLRVSWVTQGTQLVSTGSDGLLKVWTLKNNVCAATLDHHDGRTWALAVGGDGREIVTGGADSTLIWWADVTEEEKRKEMEQAQRLVEEEQTLMNLLQKKRWSKALRLALRLDQPFRGLTIVKALLDEAPTQLSIVLSKLSKNELSSLVQFAVQWNTKTKNCREAQSVINYLFTHHLPEELEALPKWSTVLEGLLPYTERHFKRISSLHQSASIMQYITACLSLSPEEYDKILDAKMEEESFLLNTIPKSKMDELPEEDMELSMGSSDDESGSDLSKDEHDMEHENQKDAPPLQSVDDIRVNYVYEKVQALTDDEDSDDSEDGGHNDDNYDDGHNNDSDDDGGHNNNNDTIDDSDDGHNNDSENIDNNDELKRSLLGAEDSDGDDWNDEDSEEISDG